MADTPAEVAVVGAGPAGRALAHRLAGRGLDVVVVDPRPDAPWQSTYACWTDELPTWIPPECTAAQSDSIRICAPDPVELPRGYTVLDNSALKRALRLDGVRIVDERAAALTQHQVITASGHRVTASVVIDARGLRDGGPRQTAWGVVVPRVQAAPVLDGAEAILMDWRPAGPDDASEPASFLYVVPLDDDRVLLEETCLAADPALPVSRLRSRLETRLGHLAVTPSATESVSFGLRSRGLPWKSRPVSFGARGGLMHPATGYSVATSLGTADMVVDAVAAGQDPLGALWPTSARGVHRLRLTGLRAVLALNADATRRFFGAFARLPLHSQRAYLSGRDDLEGTVAAMARLFAAADGRTKIALARSFAAR